MRRPVCCLITLSLTLPVAGCASSSTSTASSSTQTYPAPRAVSLSGGDNLGRVLLRDTPSFSARTEIATVPTDSGN